MRVAWASSPTHGWVLHSPVRDWLLNASSLWKADGLGKIGGGGAKALGALEKVAPEARAEGCQNASCSLIFQFSEDRSQESDQGRVVRDGAWASQSDWHGSYSEPDSLSQPSSDGEPTVLLSELMVLDQCQVNANICQAPSKVTAWEINPINQPLLSPVAGTLTEEAVASSAVEQLCRGQQTPPGLLSEYPRV